jgi:hypothetical protein
MKTKVLSFLLLGAVTALATSAVLAQDAPSDPRSAPWAPVAQPETPRAIQAVPAAPDMRVSPPIAVKKSDRLDDIIAEVVKSSPDVQVAEAQLREAEAKLRQTQMQAVQKATEAYQQRIRAEETANASKEALKKIQERKEAGTASPEEVVRAQQALAEAQAEIARYGTELQSMLGAGLKALRDSFSPPDTLFQKPLVQQPRPTLESVKNQDIKVTLDAPISIEFEKIDLTAINDYLSQYTDLNIATDPELVENGEQFSVRLTDVPVKEILLALADCSANTCFLVRDYGIFATTRDKAQQIAAPCIPDTVPLYVPKPAATKTGQSPLSPLNQTTLNF